VVKMSGSVRLVYVTVAVHLAKVVVCFDIVVLVAQGDVGNDFVRVDNQVSFVSFKISDKRVVVSILLLYTRDQHPAELRPELEQIQQKII
jgi:hypothetical protein